MSIRNSIKHRMKRIPPNTMAFGKVLSYCKYELYMARYHEMVPFIYQSFEDRKKNEAAQSFNLLDVGAGGGTLKHFLDKYDIHFYGIEFNEDRANMCRELGYKIESFNIEETIFPYPDNFFDVVVASHIIEHLYTPKKTLDEILRVTKPSGIVIIGVPMHVSWISWLLRLREKITPSVPWGHHQFYTMSTLKKFLFPHKIVDIRGVRLFSARTLIRLEDSLSFYKLSTWFGRTFPNLTPEVNAIIQKIK